MEGEPGSNWQQAYVKVNSPTGSVDSGVELSPARTITYGSFDECYRQLCNDVHCPESPAFSSESSQDEEGALGASLTQEDWDTLSDAFSPSPGDEQASVTDLTEIGHLDIQQQTSPVNRSELLAKNDSQERSVNTRKRKRTEQDCFVPKTGTAKPRQNHKKRKPQSKESKAGAKGSVLMNQKKVYSGARVKVTAREELQRERQQRLIDEELKRSGGAESGSWVRAQVAVRSVNHQPPARRQATSMDEAATSSYDISYPVSQAQGIIPHTAIPYTHSIGNILSQQSRVYHPLEILLEEAIDRGKRYPLGAYAQQQANVRCSDSGQTALLHILQKLAESKDRFPAQMIKDVTKFLCKILPDLIDTPNYQGETPIYQAARYGNEGAVRALMEEGADPWKQESSGGETALHAAVRSKKLPIVDAILCGVKSRSPFFAAGVNTPSCDGNTPLHKAAGLRDVESDIQREIVTALLASQADPSIKNNQSHMAHSFLPESLKELQVRMRRHNGCRNRNMTQPSVAARDDSPPYSHGQALQFQYPCHFTPEMIQASHIAPQNQYGNLPQAVQAFPATTQPSFAQFEPQYAPQYYVDPRTPTTNVILPQTNPDDHAEEFDDLNFDLSSF